MQMRVPYVLYLDFRVFQLHFQSIGGSLVWFDPSLSSAVPSYYTRDPWAPSHPWCLQLSIPAFGNNKSAGVWEFLCHPNRAGPKTIPSLSSPIRLASWAGAVAFEETWGFSLGSFAGLCSASLVVWSVGFWIRTGRNMEMLPPLWLIFKDDSPFRSSPPS